ncbi:MAG: hypothetical protein IJB43_04690 [Clostridia bacterium]|nr:hypothetical protein [Clostridia bacterium]
MKQTKTIRLLIFAFVLLTACLLASCVAGNGESETTNGMYDEYILSEDDLAQINEAYWQYSIADMLEDGFEPSDEDIERMKNSKYSKYAMTVEEAMRRNTEDRFYFGKYGDCFIFGIIPNPGWGGIHFPIYELGEYRISIEGNIRVAYEHEWINLSEAYERGLLSDEDAAKLYEIYCNYYKK